MIRFNCPLCGKVLKVPDKVLGKKIKCKDCEHAFVAKDPSEEAKKPTKPGVKPSTFLRSGLSRKTVLSSSGCLVEEPSELVASSSPLGRTTTPPGNQKEPPRDPGD